MGDYLSRALQRTVEQDSRKAAKIGQEMAKRRIPKSTIEAQHQPQQQILKSEDSVQAHKQFESMSKQRKQLPGLQFSTEKEVKAKQTQKSKPLSVYFKPSPINTNKTQKNETKGPLKLTINNYNFPAFRKEQIDDNYNFPVFRKGQDDA